MSNPSPPLTFHSLLFEKRRLVSVQDIAQTLGVTSQHVLDLIEEGTLQAINVGSGAETVRVPREFLGMVAKRLNVSEAEVWDLVEHARLWAPRKRPSWRITAEGWKNFVKRRHSHMDGQEKNALQDG